MEKNPPKTAPNKHKTYRRNQRSKGFVRYEIQVTADIKAAFEQLVLAAAEEMPTPPWGLRQRQAKARAQLFDEMTQEIRHDFFLLKEEIDALKAEIKALSPTLLRSIDKPTPIPQAIQSLPDDPVKLKAILSKLYIDCQQAKRNVTEYQRRAKQFEELYNASSDYCEELKEKLDTDTFKEL